MTTDKGLQVWLPFVSGLQNQGLTKITPASSPALATGGKLGNSCLSGSLTYSANSLATTFTGETFTVAFWIKLPATIKAQNFIIQYTSAPTTDKSFHLHVHANGGINFGFYSDDYNCALGLRAATWEHVVMIYDGAKKIVYKNGAYVGEASSGKLAVGTTNLIFKLGSICIQDFRIYSYALSPQEIKELSRGKVGHWLGDGNGTFLPNVLGTPMIIYQNYTKLSNNNWDISYRGSNDFVRFQNLGMNGVAGPWVVSFTAWASTEYTANIDLCDVGNKLIKIKTTPSKFFITATARNYYQTNNYNGFLDIGMPTSISKLYIRDLKMEKGTIPSAYSASNQTFLSDISGFGIHGNITGGITLSSDTKRYDKSLNFSTSDGRAYASVVQPIPNSPSSMTLSFWIKPDSASVSNYRQCFSFNNSSNWLSINTEGSKVWFYQGAKLYVKSSNGTLDSNWHHIAMVWNGSQYQFYIDGIADTTTCESAINNTLNIVAPQISTFIIGNNYTRTSNKGRLFKDYLSDIRLYATALSADDVKELYSLGH